MSEKSTPDKLNMDAKTFVEEQCDINLSVRTLSTGRWLILMEKYAKLSQSTNGKGEESKFDNLHIQFWEKHLTP